MNWSSLALRTHRSRLVAGLLALGMAVVAPAEAQVPTEEGSNRPVLRETARPPLRGELIRFPDGTVNLSVFARAST